MGLLLTEDEVMLRDTAEGFFAEKAPVKALRALRDERDETGFCLLYTSPSPRDATLSRMPSSA